MLLSANMILIHDAFGMKGTFDALAAAGFEGIDFNNDVGEYYTTEHSEQYYRELSDHAKSRGIAICQAHAPFARAVTEHIETQLPLFPRIFEFAARLGIPHIVVHTLKDYGTKYSANSGKMAFSSVSSNVSTKRWRRLLRKARGPPRKATLPWMTRPQARPLTACSTTA